MKQGQVYILKCSDNSLYTGITSNLESRLAQHQEGAFRGYTYSKRPVELIWNTDLLPIQDAIILEKQIKNWGREKKKTLVAENWEILQLLAKCKNESHYKNLSLDSARDDESINRHEN